MMQLFIYTKYIICLMYIVLCKFLIRSVFIGVQFYDNAVIVSFAMDVDNFILYLSGD